MRSAGGRTIGILISATLAFGLTSGAAFAKSAEDPALLERGDTGQDVTEVQIRVAGWAADSAAEEYVEVNGEFDAATEAAVTRFQDAYGLQTTGEVDAETQSELDALEDSDGTKNFNFSEFHSKDGAGFSGGNVGESEVKENVRRLMYKLEAIRKKAGDQPITVNSGFRSKSHNDSVGGASNSQHTYGIAADIVVSGASPGKVTDYAKTTGFSGIITYSGFVHVDSRVEYPDYGAGEWYWDNA
ncbi:putative peptidoglycan binding protein [Tamaricihabitans halophyticus]|uniref:Putative peptidoglycan binding protein n=1 Tax=Tamaricihabitans halophyticus TaxID=1262583 RepID=A0A4R2QQW3_9PSEU|nr:D-Ala-D-Ala carboxypeptidase family metallohydrolase [Tamaricihabitans halophyticus]TCP51997.1 putative peptidoglycan binding protein [Tamaricihabitans halophyticus]